MDVQELEDAVISTVQETQVKLGPVNGAVSLYLPLDSICSHRTSNCPDGILRDFVKNVRSRLGDVEYSIKEDRVRITVPKEGCIYVSKLPVSPVLTAMVDSIMEGKDSKELKASLMEISSGCVWIDVSEKEFDHVVYFKNDIDPYIYCVKEEMGHLIYHRFSRNDYLRLGFGHLL
jgi:hypothetical protein